MKKKTQPIIYFLFIWCSILNASVARIDENNIILNLDSPVDVQNLNEITEWVTQVKNATNRYMLNEESNFAKFLFKNKQMTADDRSLLSYRVEVRPVKNLNDVYVVLFYSRLHMTKTLIPATVWDGVSELPLSDNLFLQESLEACRGLKCSQIHLENYFEKSKQSNHKLYPEETAFRDHVLVKLTNESTNNKVTFIALNVIGFALDTLGHELAHVYWDKDVRFRTAIIKYWVNHLTVEEQNNVIKLFSPNYNVSDVMNVINEFGAFLLQPKIGIMMSEVLQDLVPKHYVELQRQLIKAGAPIPFANDKTCEDLLR